MALVGENLKHVSEGLLSDPRLVVAGVIDRDIPRKQTTPYVGPPERLITIYARPKVPEFDIEKLNKLLLGAVDGLMPSFQHWFSLGKDGENRDSLLVGSLMYNDNFVTEAIGEQVTKTRQERTIFRVYPSAAHLANAITGKNVDTIPLDELASATAPDSTPLLRPLESILL